MDPIHSPDGSDVRPSFRKPSNDTASRKYRRYSPVGRSDSSSSDGSLKRESSPAYPVNDRNKMSDDRRRKDDSRESERESIRPRSSRVGDSHRHSARPPYENSHNYRRHSNDHGRHERHAGEEDRSYHRSTRSGRESRGGTRNDNARNDDNSDRYRDKWREAKYTRDRSENPGHMHKDKEIETMVSDHRRHKDRDSERTVSGNKAFNSSRDDVKSGEREKYRNRDAEDAKKDHYKSSGYKNDHVSHDPVLEIDTEAPRAKETHRNNDKENCKTEDLGQKRKHNERETDKRKGKYTGEADEEIPYKSSSVSSYRERDGRNERYIDRTSTEDHNSSAKKIKFAPLEASDEKPSSSSKQVAGTAEIIASKPVNSFSSHADAGNGLDAAKVAAIKAAELVNKNLVGGAYLSTDQKKKLLWGHKKNTVAEESQPGNRWDIPLFADRERQEKFNKLMGVKGEAVSERKSDDKDVEKQRELLNMDLEKQYTAGLRRRDGRTVGLGL